MNRVKMIIFIKTEVRIFPLPLNVISPLKATVTFPFETFCNETFLKLEKWRVENLQGDKRDLSKCVAVGKKAFSEKMVFHSRVFPTRLRLGGYETFILPVINISLLYLILQKKKKRFAAKQFQSRAPWKRIWNPGSLP